MDAYNPRQPDPSDTRFFLVPKDKSKVLRYPPQHAEVTCATQMDAQYAQWCLRRRGIKYWVYDAMGIRYSRWRD